MRLQPKLNYTFLPTYLSFSENFQKYYNWKTTQNSLFITYVFIRAELQARARMIFKLYKRNFNLTNAFETVEYLLSIQRIQRTKKKKM